MTSCLTKLCAEKSRLGGTVEGNPIKIHFCNTCDKLGQCFYLETDTEKTDGTFALFHILYLIEVIGGDKICLSTNFPFPLPSVTRWVRGGWASWRPHEYAVTRPHYTSSANPQLCHSFIFISLFGELKSFYLLIQEDFWPFFPFFVKKCIMF